MLKTFLADASPDAVTEAIEQGVTEFTAAFVRQGGGIVHEEPEITVVSTGTPLAFYNGVIRTRLAEGRADTVIASLLVRFREHRHPTWWWTMPHTRPADMPARLAARGFELFDRDLGMAVDLATIPEAAPLPSGVAIERAGTPEALREWLRAFGAGFRVPEDRLTAYSAMPFGAAPARSVVRYYLARADGAPVGTALLYPGRQVAVIEEVSTVPAMRGRGIGTAVTIAALRDGRALGYRIAVLVASDAGARVYRRLGFKPYGDREIYLWRPDSP